MQSSSSFLVKVSFSLDFVMTRDAIPSQKLSYRNTSIIKSWNFHYQTKLTGRECSNNARQW